MTPVFSLCHATARLPDGWWAAARAWIDNCLVPSRIDYVLAVDILQYGALEIPDDIPGRVHFRPVVNTARPCAVDAWNRAAAESRGQFLITVADDFFPPLHWDQLLLNVCPTLYNEHVVAVNEGRSDNLLCHSFLTRAYYNRIGGRLFWPEYDGMYADNEFTAIAYRDNVVIEARHLKFEHRHPAYGLRADDDLDRRHQSKENYALGRRVFERRKAEGFTGVVSR